MDVEDVWQTRVEGLWSGLDAVAMHALRELLPEVPSEGMSLADWNAKRDVVITELDATPTLILFDQDFHHEGGGAEDGQRLIAELQVALTARAPTLPDAYYGLLANTVEVDQEYQRRGEIIAAAGLDSARFVLISKQNLADEELRRFASRLRTILLAPLFVDLMEEVVDKVRSTQDQALDVVPRSVVHPGRVGG
jgi:hypothetical protein